MKEINIKKINGSREENDLVLYTNKKFHNTNQYGFEVAVLNNIAAFKAINVELNENNFVLSAHGESVKFLKDIELGDEIILNDNMSSFIVKKDPYRSLKYNQQMYIELYEKLLNYTKNNYILYNEDLFKKYDNLFKDILNKIDNITLDNIDENLINIYKNNLINYFDMIKAILTEENPLQFRCVWHRPNENSSEEVESFVKWLKSLNFNVLFVEAYYGGRTCYKSEFLETHPSLINNKYDGFDDDYLKCLIHFCKFENIQVHLWNHALNAGNAHISINENIKDEWLLRNYQGSIAHYTTYGDTYYLDPSNDEVIDFVTSIYTEQANKYDIDGVQLDYIRYYENNYYDLNNIQESGFGTHSENKFKQLYNLDLNLDIRKELVSNLDIKNKFFEFRQQNVYNLVKKIYKEVKSINSNIIVSASVVGDIRTAKNTYMQNWDEWILNGYVDLLNPMIYTGDYSYLKNISLKINEFLNNRAFLASGIGSLYYNYPEIEHQNQINILNEININGYSVFAAHNLLRHKNVCELMNKVSNKVFPINIFDTEENLVKNYIPYLLEKYNKIVNLYKLNLDDLNEVIYTITKQNDIHDMLLYVNYLKNNCLKDKVINDLKYILNVIKTNTIIKNRRG